MSHPTEWDQKQELESELQRFEASYIQLLQHTSMEIQKLKSFIRVLRSIDDNKRTTSNLSIISHQNMYNHSIQTHELNIYHHTEPIDHKYIHQRIEILRESKLALIKLTSFEMNRLRDIIKRLMNKIDGSNIHSDTNSISTIESSNNTHSHDAYDLKHPLMASKVFSLTARSKPDAMGSKSHYMWTEIEKHNKRDDLWVVYDQKIYDITGFLPFHPGGADVIVEISQKNQNITNALNRMNHPPIVKHIMVQHFIGDVLNAEEIKTRKRKDSFSTLQPVWDELQHNLTVRLSEEEYPETDVLIVWSNLWSVKVDILDKQHEDLVNIINDLYNTFELRDALQLLHRWDVHCKTEEALFYYYKFDEKTQIGHISDHKKMYYAIKDQITDLRIKYNHEKRVCHELIDFAQEFAKMFKEHHFKYDVEYIDYLDFE